MAFMATIKRGADTVAEQAVTVHSLWEQGDLELSESILEQMIQDCDTLKRQCQVHLDNVRGLALKST